MIIGEFTYDKDTDTYTGSIRTMTVHLGEVRFFPYDDLSPPADFDYGVSAYTLNGFVDCGEARRAISSNGTRYLDVVIDDPAFAKPITAHLIPMPDSPRVALAWVRPKRRWFGL